MPSEAVGLQRLEDLVASDPTQRDAWRVWADGLAEVDRQPAFLRHALAGGRVPSAEYLTPLRALIEQNHLQLLFNEFHYVEAAWVRPPSPSLIEPMLQSLLSLPMAQMLTRLTLALGVSGQAFDATALAFAQQALSVLARGPALPALRSLSLGFASQPVAIPNSIELLARVRQRAPRLETGPRQLVAAVRRPQVVLVSCAPEVSFEGLAVGAAVDAGRRRVGTLPGRGAHEADVRLLGPAAVHGLIELSSSLQSPGLSMRVLAGSVVLNNTALAVRAVPVPLMPGDSLELGPGALFEVRGLGSATPA